jgi:hypothetical protein
VAGRCFALKEIAAKGTKSAKGGEKKNSRKERKERKEKELGTADLQADRPSLPSVKENL